ncbi:copper chaperone PCu(A)C [Zhihengliuella sp. ISTPL4]|uniref:copper chaperone PCu(A)C n=1 Tax=Zhihengliuella sp. ISTPL4 TaxID=2058657 RepID=UPI000C7B918F|nr:copper chaperone PCu(A)C [Zhihengliuella sp. ISTPL4]
MNTRTSLPRLGATIALSLVALTGCTAPAAEPPAAAPAGEALRIDDAWVKSADEGMTAAFGMLRNEGDGDVTVTSVASAASPMIELHETVENEAGEMVMREIAGGFVVPAGGGLALEPGGNHIMMMDLAEPLRAGDEVAFTVTLSDNSTFDFTAPVKDYSGANENYDDADDHEGMDH